MCSILFRDKFWHSLGISGKIDTFVISKAGDFPTNLDNILPSFALKSDFLDFRTEKLDFEKT